MSEIYCESHLQSFELLKFRAFEKFILSPSLPVPVLEKVETELEHSKIRTGSAAVAFANTFVSQHEAKTSSKALHIDEKLIDKLKDLSFAGVKVLATYGNFIIARSNYDYANDYSSKISDEKLVNDTLKALKKIHSLPAGKQVIDLGQTGAPLLITISNLTAGSYEPGFRPKPGDHRKTSSSYDKNYDQIEFNPYQAIVTKKGAKIPGWLLLGHELIHRMHETLARKQNNSTAKLKADVLHRNESTRSFQAFANSDHFSNTLCNTPNGVIDEEDLTNFLQNILAAQSKAKISPRLKYGEEETFVQTKDPFEIP